MLDDSVFTADMGSAYLATTYSGLCLELEINYAMDRFVFNSY